MIIKITDYDLINFANRKETLKVRKDYSISDLVLIRTTDIFPKDGEIHSKAIDKALAETIPLFNSALKKNKYDKSVLPKYFNYRSTIHFCLNGLVGNHMLGNFSSRDYFIFDKYNSQQNEMIALRAEDTYFKEIYNLSDEAFIAMSSGKFEELKDDLSMVSFLEKYDVYVYNISDDLKQKLCDGDIENADMIIEQLIVSYILNSRGYPAFLIGDHGYIGSIDRDKDAYYMQQFLNRYCSDNNLSSEKHYYSKVREDDYSINVINMINSAIDHYEYVVSNSSVDIEFKQVLLSYVPYMRERSILHYDVGILDHMFEGATANIDKFINIIGEEEYNKLTSSYNKVLEETRYRLLEEGKSL